MLVLLFIWLMVGIAFMFIGKRQDSAGLPLAYFLGLSLIHTPGASLYLDTEAAGTNGLLTQIGFEQTVIELVSFLFAVLLHRFFAAPRYRARYGGSGHIQQLTSHRAAALDRLSRRYLAIGGVCYFLLLPLLGGVATVTAVISSLGALIMVGLCLRLWLAGETRNSAKFWLTIPIIIVLPLFTVVQNGFIGYGMYWVIAIVSFFFYQSKRRLWYFFLAPIIAFVGISVFVNYMAARQDLRQRIWVQQVDTSDRLARIADVFLNFEWFDGANARNRSAIDDRLNQNLLVGAAVQRLEFGQVDYAQGASIISLLTALIPRAIWPDKPVVGGGGSVAHDFTGMDFAEGTSIGAGQVLEFYANFGTFGVIGGFLFYGWLLGMMDLKVIWSLRTGDQAGFVFWFLISLALLQPGGNLLEIVVSAASSAIAAYGLGRFVIPKQITAGYSNIGNLTSAGA